MTNNYQNCLQTGKIFQLRFDLMVLINIKYFNVYFYVLFLKKPKNFFRFLGFHFDKRCRSVG